MSENDIGRREEKIRTTGDLERVKYTSSLRVLSIRGEPVSKIGGTKAKNENQTQSAVNLDRSWPACRADVPVTPDLLHFFVVVAPAILNQ